VVLFVACVPHAPRVTVPTRIDSSCGTKPVRVSAIESIVTSTDDKIRPDDRPAWSSVRHDLDANGGAIAYWNDLLLMVPRTSRALGETDGYARVRAAAISATAPAGMPTRRIALLVRDHGAYRWIAMSAYGLQDICVEGRREG
jgi:hypothetical protein